MIAKKEIRAEREDVVSFWVDKKIINSNDEIEVIEEKIDECTVVELEARIEQANVQIATLNETIALEMSKIALAIALNV
jgi:energy-converting hydrogenase A subunit M